MRRGVLLVGPMSDGPIVGGIENGIDMILRSSLVADYRLVFFNSYRQPDRTRSLLARCSYQVGAYLRFIGTLLRRRPRLVHVKVAERVNFVQGIGYCLLARLAGCRVLLQIHGGSFDAWFRAMAPGRRRLLQCGLARATAILVLSEYWQRFVQPLAPGVPVHIVPNGVEHVVPAPVASDGARGRIRVVTLGAVGVRKGHFDIVEAARLLADARILFRFVGSDEEGGELDRLRTLIAEASLGGSFELLGALSGEAKWRALHDADVFLLPARNENMPNAILEAMASGLPVICTDVGAIREMVGDAGAIYVRPGEPREVADAVRLLAADAARRETMGRANRARVAERYSFEHVRHLLAALYDRYGTRFPQPNHGLLARTG